MARQSLPQSRASSTSLMSNSSPNRRSSTPNPNMSTPEGPAYSPPPRRTTPRNRRNPNMSTPDQNMSREVPDFNFRDVKEYKPPETVMSIPDRNRSIELPQRRNMSVERTPPTRSMSIERSQPRMSEEVSRDEMQRFQDRGFIRREQEQTDWNRYFGSGKQYPDRAVDDVLSTNIRRAKDIIGTDQSRPLSEDDAGRLKRLTQGIEGLASTNDVTLTEETRGALQRGRDQTVIAENPWLVDLKKRLETNKGDPESQFNILSEELDKQVERKFITDETSQEIFLDLASTIKRDTDKNLQSIKFLAEKDEQEVDSFISEVEDKKLGDTTIKKILDDPELRKSYEKEFRELEKEQGLTEDSTQPIRDTDLALFLYGKGIDEEVQGKRQKVLNEVEKVDQQLNQFLAEKQPEVEYYIDEQGNEQKQYMFDNQKDVEAFNRIVKVRNKKVVDYQSVVEETQKMPEDYDNILSSFNDASEVNPEIIEKFNEYNVGNYAAGQFYDQVRRKDWVEYKKDLMQQKMDEDRFSSQSIMPWIGKNLGGAALELGQGLAYIPSELKKSAGYGGTSTVSRIEGDRLLKNAGITTQSQKALDSMIFSATLPLGGAASAVGGKAVVGVARSAASKAGIRTASRFLPSLSRLGIKRGGSSFIGGINSLLTASAGSAAGGEAAKRIMFVRANDEEKRFLTDNITVVEDSVRAGLRQEQGTIEEGWGGAYGNIRSAAADVPGLRLTGLGSKEDYLEGVEQYLKSQGFTGEELDRGVNVARKYRRTLEGGKAGAILGGNIAAEIFGRAALSRRIMRGLISPKKTFGDSLSVSKGLFFPGMVEGAAVARAQKDSRLEETSLSDLSEGMLAGGVTASAVGLPLTGFGFAGKSGVIGNIGRGIAKSTQVSGYIVDPPEFFGDVSASVLERTFRGVSRFTGRVRPKTFVLQRSIGNNVDNVPINTRDVVGVQTSSDGKIVLQMKDKGTITLADTSQNRKQVKAMNDYLNKELSGVSSDVQSQSFPEQGGLARSSGMTDSLSRTKPLSRSDIDSIIDSRSRVRSQPQSNIQSQPLTQANVQGQTNVQTQPMANVQALANPFARSQLTTQTQAMAGNAGFPFPYGRVQLGKSYPGFQRRQGVQQFLKENQIQDYATSFFKTSGKTDAQRAKSAVNRLFGKNTASGEQFKKNNGGVLDNTPKKNSNFRSKVFGSKKK